MYNQLKQLIKANFTRSHSYISNKKKILFVPKQKDYRIKSFIKFLKLNVFINYVLILLTSNKVFKKLYAIEKACSIRFNFYLSNKKRVLIVYDCIDNPATYGDFINFLAFARYFEKKGKFIDFVIISSELRLSWERLKKRKIKWFIEDLKRLAKLLLLNSKSKVYNTNWEEFNKNFLSNHKNYFIPFKKNVFNRKRFYNSLFNVINFLLFFETNKFYNQVLLNKRSFYNLEKKEVFIPKLNYFTLHARYLKNSQDSPYSSKISTARNLNKKDFIEIIKKILEKFPTKKIVIITDSNGQKYFKKISKSFESSLIFSKKISKSFLGDMSLILNSKRYFCYVGGGITATAIYSKIPYTVGWTTNVSNEVYWQKNKYTVWQNKNQICANIKKVENFFELIAQHT